MIANDALNSIFPGWTIKSVIGAGSYGKVYELERVEDDAVYRSALKVISIPQDEGEIRTRLAEGESRDSVTAYYDDVTKNLLNENRVMAGLKGNSNIVSYEDHQVVKHEDGIGCDIFIRMELLTPFIDYMADNRIKEDTAIRLGIDICKALEICERKNVIHRDIKPGNIFLSDTGDFKLGDFGIARTIDRTTGGLSKKGTYRYMAPEVYKGDPYGKTVDICSLGLVMYYLMNGNRTPFLPDAPAPVSYIDEENALLRRMNGEEIPPPKNADSGLSDIILKACSYNSSYRYQSASEMKADLEVLRTGSFRGVASQSQGQSIRIASSIPRGQAGSVGVEPAYRQPAIVHASMNHKTGGYPAGKKQIIIVVAGAVIVLLIGIPLLLHLTKTPSDIDGNINFDKNSKATEEVRIADVKPDEASLKNFFENFIFYCVRNDTEYKFDHSKTDAMIVMDSVMWNISCVNFKMYPDGENIRKDLWDEYSDAEDPRGWAVDNDGTVSRMVIEYDAAGIDWIMKNIFNYSQDAIDNAVKREEIEVENKQNEYDDGTKYGFYRDHDKYYFITGGIGWETSYNADINSIERDGEFYTVRYTMTETFMLESEEPVVYTCTAKMQYKKIGEWYYWSLYEHRID